MTHAWCRDPSRDERVRAAEDGRAGPLPTLEECIERQKQTARPCGGTDPAPSRGERGAADTGLRTERVLLEITHKSPTSAAEFLPRRLWWDRKGESVRVVEEPVGSVDDRAYADSMACDEERDFANRILAERDAAIRERDAAKARVAELEAIHSFLKSPAESCKEERDAGNGGCGACAICCGELRQKLELVESAQAASGGGEGEPDAWGVVRDGNVESVTHRRFRGDADRVAEQWGETVVPLYRSPPQPRGWLTGDDWEALRYASQGLREAGGISNVQAMKQIDDLLARSTPPEVRLPLADLGDRLLRDGVIDALAAAGVAVKEEGK